MYIRLREQLYPIHDIMTKVLLMPEDILSLQNKKYHIKSATKIKSGKVNNQTRTILLFSIHVSHSCCLPLIYAHGLKKMW